MGHHTVVDRWLATVKRARKRIDCFIVIGRYLHATKYKSLRETASHAM